MGIRDVPFPFNGAIATATINILDTAVQVPSAGNNPNRAGIMVFNISTKNMFYGGSDVTIANGFPLLKNEGAFIPASGDVDIFFIITPTGGDLRFFEVIQND